MVDFRCKILLSSWALDNRRLKLDFEGRRDFDLSIYSRSNEWTLVDRHSGQRVDTEWTLVGSSASKHIQRRQCGSTGYLEFNYLMYSV